MPFKDTSEDLHERISRELKHARASRLQGNEGKARVCARRAAGWAVESVYEKDASEVAREANAYHFLLWFKEQEQIPREIRAAALRLTTRVSEEFNLPFEQDPLDDAEFIVGWVLGSKDID